MEELKVGDKVYKMEGTYYLFSEVVRLTKTRAILKNGTKLINEPRLSWVGEVVEYKEYGTKAGAYSYSMRSTEWSIVTPEILAAEKEQRELQVKLIWFSKKSWTKEEKVIIYNTFKELGKL